MLLSCTGMMAYPPFRRRALQKENIERGWKGMEADRKKLYLACTESPGPGEGRRKAFIKVSTRKAPPPTTTTTTTHSLSARINAPKSPKARSSYILSIIQPASFVQPLLFTRTAWPIVNVCVPAEPPSPPNHTRWLHSDLALFCHPPPPPHHSHLRWRGICQAGTEAAVEADSPKLYGRTG